MRRLLIELQLFGSLSIISAHLRVFARSFASGHISYTHFCMRVTTMRFYSQVPTGVDFFFSPFAQISADRTARKMPTTLSCAQNQKQQITHSSNNRSKLCRSSTRPKHPLSFFFWKRRRLISLNFSVNSPSSTHPTHFYFSGRHVRHFWLRTLQTAAHQRAGAGLPHHWPQAPRVPRLRLSGRLH